MNKNFNTILFDLDGTLVDSQKGIFNALSYMVNERNLEKPSQEILRTFIGPPLPDSLRVHFHMKDEEIDLAMKSYRSYYNEHGVHEFTVYQDIELVLETLLRNGKTLGVATSKPEEPAKRIIEHAGLSSYFATITGATFDESRSSKTQVIATALERLHHPDKTQILMIGDREHDMIGAQANQIQAIGVTYGYGKKEEFLPFSPYAIIDSPKQLLTYV
nr:HAD hydrolase-like protein [Bacilli bacterium]